LERKKGIHDAALELCLSLGQYDAIGRPGARLRTAQAMRAVLRPNVDDWSRIVAGP
jgi:hypothetical protein